MRTFLGRTHSLSLRQEINHKTRVKTPWSSLMNPNRYDRRLIDTGIVLIEHPKLNPQNATLINVRHLHTNDRDFFLSKLYSLQQDYK
jgi:coproporphyrinogen III oxidase